MTNFREKLDALIDSFLARRLEFVEFQRRYSACYIDEQADAEFSPEEVDHYGVVHEKAEWTSPSPTEEERRYGWIDQAEFRSWLQIHEQQKPK